MKRKSAWIVGDEGIRPRGPRDRCFYCDRRKGEQHKPDCVIRCRTVVVRFTIDLVVAEPEYEDRHSIEFMYNESSWCADNLIKMLDQAKSGMPCLCPVVSADFVREATENDEEQQRLFAEDLPS